jgi:hypothetical protein
MFEGHSDIGVAAQASPQAAAHQGLLERLEQLLPSQDFADATEAYEEYADAYAQAVSDPLVSQRIAGASQRLADALSRALEDGQVRSRVIDAATEYLRLIEEAWPRLTGEDPDSEAFAAVATGMTTLAYLFGLGNDGLAGHLSVTSPFAPATWEGSWSRQASTVQAAAESDGSPWDSPADTDRIGDVDESPAPDDDGIVWQEFSVGDDGQIVQRAAPSRASGNPSRGSRPASSPAAAPLHEDRNATTASAKTTSSARRTDAGQGATPTDPVQLVEHAYASYVEALRDAGAYPPKDIEGLAPSQRADGSPNGLPQSELDQRAAELVSAYLRLAQGIGYAPDPYLSYCRLLGTATELAQRQLALLHSYERLLDRTAQTKQAGNVKTAADVQYRRFLTAVRTAWSQVDPASLSPERLSAMTASTARAADLYQTAMNMAGSPFTP